RTPVPRGRKENGETAQTPSCQPSAIRDQLPGNSRTAQTHSQQPSAISYALLSGWLVVAAGNYRGRRSSLKSTTHGAVPRPWGRAGQPWANGRPSNARDQSACRNEATLVQSVSSPRF